MILFNIYIYKFLRMSAKKSQKEKWEKPEITSMELKLTGGKFDNGGNEVPLGEPGAGLVGPGS